MIVSSKTTEQRRLANTPGRQGHVAPAGNKGMQKRNLKRKSGRLALQTAPWVHEARVCARSLRGETHSNKGRQVSWAIDGLVDGLRITQAGQGHDRRA